MPRGFLCTENPQLGWGFRKAFSFEPVIKTPFDLLKHLAVWQLQVSFFVHRKPPARLGVPESFQL
ncbi:hypothetical protein BFD49_08990 [Escherichia coli]|nr:hypothetical protein BFD49_08990 [Escherichia coli]